jgi:hypothetical protein
LPLRPAAAKIGANVETAPSINPSNAGWTFCRTKLRPLMVLLERFDFVGMNFLHKVRRHG